MFDRKKALSMLELVFALGILSFASGAVMTTVVAGVAGPARSQHSAQRSTLAVELLQKAMAAGSPMVVPLTPIPGHPDFSYEVNVSTATFNPTVSILEVSVMGSNCPGPVTTLRGTHMAPTGPAAMQTYACLSCHGLGNGPSPYTPATAPNLTMPVINAGRLSYNLAKGKSLSVDEYIEESIRLPNDFVTPGWLAGMSSYPTVATMPAADLNAMRAYIKTL